MSNPLTLVKKTPESRQNHPSPHCHSSETPYLCIVKTRITSKKNGASELPSTSQDAVDEVFKKVFRITI
jgi:hypothetical protein